MSYFALQAIAERGLKGNNKIQNALVLYLCASPTKSIYRVLQFAQTCFENSFKEFSVFICNLQYAPFMCTLSISSLKSSGPGSTYKLISLVKVIYKRDP